MTKEKIETLFLDLDGTLINSGPMIRKVLSILLSKYQDAQLTESLLKELHGLPAKEIFERIHPELVTDVTEDVLRLEEEYRHLAPMYPGIMPLIEKLHANKILLGVITSQVRQEMENVKQVYPFAPYIQVWISSDDVTHPKPHPESVFRGLKALSANPQTTLFLGDTRFDIEAGKQAGVLTGVALWNGNNTTRVLLSLEPDFVFCTPEEVWKVVSGCAN